MGEMAGEVGAELVQRGRPQARLQQPLCLACPLQQRAVDQLLDRAAAAGVAGADLHQRWCAHGQIDVMQGDRCSVAGQLAATAMTAGAAYQAGLVQLRQQTADHHRMGRQAGRQLPGGARAILADQMRHHVQGVRERVRGFHVTTVVTFISPVQGPYLFHMDTFVL